MQKKKNYKAMLLITCSSHSTSCGTKDKSSSRNVWNMSIKMEHHHFQILGN